MRDERTLRCSVAFVWAATALLVLHPTYRAEGQVWLDRLGLGPVWMWLACAGELVLAIWIVLRPTTRALALLQTVAVLGFTTTLALLEPLLLAHPFGVLSKNLPLLFVLWTAAALHRDQAWTPATQRLLQVGVAVPWFTEGLFPKVLFQQPLELAVVSGSGLVPIDPGLFLTLLGFAQIAAAVATVTLRGRTLRLLLLGQAAALVLLPLLVSWQLPWLWVHPFGPLTKNVPILVGTLVLWRQLR